MGHLVKKSYKKKAYIYKISRCAGLVCIAIFNGGDLHKRSNDDDGRIQCWENAAGRQRSARELNSKGGSNDVIFWDGSINVISFKFRIPLKHRRKKKTKRGP